MSQKTNKKRINKTFNGFNSCKNKNPNTRKISKKLNIRTNSIKKILKNWNKFLKKTTLKNKKWRK